MVHLKRVVVDTCAIILCIHQTNINLKIETLMILAVWTLITVRHTEYTVQQLIAVTTKLQLHVSMTNPIMSVVHVCLFCSHIAFAWGDPHFETFDGKTYTFNGVGEFVLFNSDANELRVQVRLEQYLSFQASVITSLAVKNKQIPTIQLELDVSNKYVLYFDGIIKSEALPAQGKMTAFTANAIYQNNSLSEIDFENDDYILLRNINDTYVIVTGSGAAIRIGRELTFLYCIMEISADLYYDSTEGLWGYFDNDPSNDFYLPDGSTMSETSTESELFEGFGMKCKLKAFYVLIS